MSTYVFTGQVLESSPGEVVLRVEVPLKGGLDSGEDLTATVGIEAPSLGVATTGVWLIGTNPEPYVISGSLFGITLEEVQGALAIEN
jgi:hypothetical protein